MLVSQNSNKIPSFISRLAYFIGTTMDEEEFRKRAEQITDYILNYIKTISKRPVSPHVSPGILSNALPPEAPEKGETFEKILEDVENVLMPGMIHWDHPRFHAYFPASSSFPSTLAEVISDTIGCAGLNWNLSPALEEIEWIVTDWYGQLMGLPDQFLRYAEGSKGGGIIQNSSSECVLYSMLAARDTVLEKLIQKDPSSTKVDLLSSLVAYCSEEAHCCVEKAAILSLVNIRILPADEDFRLRGETLAKAIEEDKKNGLVPFYVSLTIGTTSCCACDPIKETGEICKDNDLWLHVDAAYAGTATICPEYRDLLDGMGYARSYNVNAAKWLLVNIECAVMFVTDRSKHDDIVADRMMFRYGSDEDEAVHSSTRRCRAFKLWFVLSCYGVEGVQVHVRNHMGLAKLFARLVEGDPRFELVQCRFGLVCFRLAGSNALNKQLLKIINDSSKLHMIATSMHGKYVLRFCVCYFAASESDIRYAWNFIKGFATQQLQKERAYAYITYLHHDVTMDSSS